MNKWLNLTFEKDYEECPSSLGTIHSPQITAPISMCRLVICWCMHTFLLHIGTSSSNSFQLKFFLLPTLRLYFSSPSHKSVFFYNFIHRRCKDRRMCSEVASNIMWTHMSSGWIIIIVIANIFCVPGIILNTVRYLILILWSRYYLISVQMRKWSHREVK